MSTPEPARPVDLLEQLAAEEEAERAAASETAQAARDAASTAAPQAPDGATPEQQAAWAARFADPDTMFQSYTALEKKLGEQGNELGELRQFRQQAEPVLTQLAAQQTQPQPAAGQQYLPNGTPIYDQQQLVELKETDPASYTDLMLQYQAFALEQSFEQRMNDMIAQRLGPLEQERVTRGAQNTLDELNVALGDDVVARHSEYIAQLIQADRPHFADPQHGARRLREAVIAAEYDRQATGAAAQPRDQQGRFVPDVHVEGGSSAQPPAPAGGTRMDPEEQELLQSLTAGRPVDEMGIPLPR